MKNIRTWVLILGALIGVTVGGFYFYSSFLLDYSLENLEVALQGTQQDSTATSSLGESLYSSLAQEVALEEASQENADFKNVLFLDKASNALGQSVERGGQKRAKFYLTEVLKSKLSDRSPILKSLDPLMRKGQRGTSFVMAFVDYVRERVMPSKNKGKIEPQTGGYSSLVLLGQAQEREKNGNPQEARQLYQKYLKLFPKTPERGLVSVALARLLIRSNQWREAEPILKRVQKEFAGRLEWGFARILLQKIEQLKEKEKVIGQLLVAISGARNTAEEENFHFQLGLAYLSSYQFVPALENFKRVENASSAELRERARFYMGWLYKLTSQYNESEKVFQELLKDSKIQGEMSLALRSQLAEVYSLKNEPAKAVSEYKALAQEAKKETKTQASAESITAMAELEQVQIYYFDLNEQKKAEQQLDILDATQTASEDLDIGSMKKDLSENASSSAMEKAFTDFQSGKFNDAGQAFERRLSDSPEDAWINAGFATTRAMEGDLTQAKEYAEKAYYLRPDEYTASVLGYIEGQMGRYNEAISRYQEAGGLNPRYLPAQFNLACVYLQAGKYSEGATVLENLYEQFRKTKSFMLTKILNNLGIAQWRLGKKEEAIQSFREALKNAPSFEIAKNNLRRILQER